MENFCKIFFNSASAKKFARQKEQLGIGWKVFGLILYFANKQLQILITEKYSVGLFVTIV